MRGPIECPVHGGNRSDVCATCKIQELSEDMRCDAYRIGRLAGLAFRALEGGYDILVELYHQKRYTKELETHIQKAAPWTWSRNGGQSAGAKLSQWQEHADVWSKGAVALLKRGGAM